VEKTNKVENDELFLSVTPCGRGEGIGVFVSDANTAANNATCIAATRICASAPGPGRKVACERCGAVMDRSHVREHQNRAICAARQQQQRRQQQQQQPVQPEPPANNDDVQDELNSNDFNSDDNSNSSCTISDIELRFRKRLRSNDGDDNDLPTVSNR
jgi:hypothetical protein